MTDKVTIHTLQKRKRKGERIVALTAYDATFARLLDEAGVDLLLVGDSLGMVVQGLPNTLPVTLEEVIYHTRAVARGIERAHLVADLPFLSYQCGEDEAVKNAGRLIKEGGAEAVKLEGGAPVAALVRRLSAIGVPVLGHVGLTPQSVHALGGFRIQGRCDESAARIREDARALADAGCYAVVLEGIPAELAAGITADLPIPTIGIGAGAGCDGQILVIYDLLGMDDRFRPRFVKRYENLALRIRTACESFGREVREGRFPGEEHTFRAGGERAPAGETREATPYGGGRRA